jgi:hypothetical protein
MKTELQKTEKRILEPQKQVKLLSSNLPVIGSNFTKLCPVHKGKCFRQECYSSSGCVLMQ